ncbi:hypothetical protein HYU23_00505 [Candidatus Woesearchaeota archaeon]|nr:hypothetical protein [Candidatus Woesearchaeota archaeon]
MNKNNDKHDEYYEAILQIRPDNKEVLNFVFDLVEGRNDVKVSKIVELKTGCDVYLTNQKFARGTLAKQLKRKYKNSKIVITKSLYGQHKMTSRLVYRATILFRLE